KQKPKLFLYESAEPEQRDEALAVAAGANHVVEIPDRLGNDLDSLAFIRLGRIVIEVRCEVGVHRLGRESGADVERREQLPVAGRLPDLLPQLAARDVGWLLAFDVELSRGKLQEGLFTDDLAR